MKDNSNNRIETKKSAKLFLLLLFNIALFISILYAFELYLRISDPRGNLPIHGMIEDESDPSKTNEYTWGHLVNYNRFYFRERDFKTPKPAGIYRIMVLGDSFTFGTGLSTDERYTQLIEDRLNKESPPNNLKFEVLNFGFEGVPTVYERDILLYGIEKMEPDLIIVGFTVNDPCKLGEENTIEKHEFDKLWRAHIKNIKKLATIVALKHTGESFERAVYRLAEKRGIIPKWQVAIERSYDKSLPQWKQFVKALSDMKRLSDDARLPQPILAILTQPVYIDRPTDYTKPDDETLRYIHWYDQGELAAKEAGFRTLNYKEEFIESFSNEYAGINILDRHPGVKLNKLYAEKLYKIIKNEYLGQH